MPGPEIVTRQGKLIPVIIPIKPNEALSRRAEDPDIVAECARRKPLRYRPLEEYLAEPRSR